MIIECSLTALFQKCMHGSTENSESEQPLFPVAVPLTWTSLLLQWNSSICSIPYACQLVNASYIITLTTSDGKTEFAVTGDDTVLDLEGYECEQVTVDISLPGNCKPAQISPTLLQGIYSNHVVRHSTSCVTDFNTDPPYPKPEDLQIVFFNTTSFAFTWKHPDSSSLFEVNDEYFNYSVVVATVQYYTAIRSTEVPREEVYLIGYVETCQQINVSVSLVRDCRLLQATVTLPTCESIAHNIMENFYVFFLLIKDPQEFSSATVHVKPLFTAELSLQKIEIMFKVGTNKIITQH